MGKLAGKHRQRRKGPRYHHADPIKGVNVAEQRVDLIVRKVEPSQMTAPKQHIHSPFRKKGAP